MATRYVNVDRRTPMLLPVDMREWVPEDDMVHFVIAAVEQRDLRLAEVNLRGSGSEQYPPSMMTALLIYCYAHGIFSSRKIERATYRDIAVRYLSGDTHPDHDTIATFRRRNGELFAQCFVEVLEMAEQIRVLKVGTVSIDGTKMGANASKYKSLSYERCEELLPRLEQQVQELVKQAEEVDSTESDAGDRLPEELARHEKLKEKLGKAKAAAEQSAYEVPLCGIEARNKRKQTVEPVFGIIKEVLGFRRFHLRGISKVDTEWHLVCLSYNFKRLFNLIANNAAIKTA